MASDQDSASSFASSRQRQAFIARAAASVADASAQVGQVRYFPRTGYESRMVGGQFQGSSDNSTWTTLYTVAAAPSDAYTTATTSADPATFRYLRYLAPDGSYGNVAEIEFDSGGVKLTGTPFGTPGSYYNSGSDYTKVLDGDTTTYFDAPYPGNGDYVGIDQGPTAQVGQVRYFPRTGYESRMVGGQFQGSSDNSAWTTLYTITAVPSDVYTTIPLTSGPRIFRYLRYLAPDSSYGNAAEIEFDNGTGSNAGKLTGTPFGTPGSWANQGNDYTKVLDGDAATYFDAPYPGNGDYAGIDLGLNPPPVGNKVFAHFQMSCYDYGTIPSGGVGSVSGYVQDITEAASMGIDGFSLDYGANVWPYPDNLANMFTAADQYNAQHPNAPFTPFLTFDCATLQDKNNPTAVAPIISSVTAKYANDAAYYHYLGRPFLSTYTGEGGGYATVKNVFGQALATLRSQGINPYFIPGFITTDPSGNYIGDSPANDAAWTSNLLSGFADGAWQYANAGPPAGPGSGIFSNQNKAAAVEAAGLTWMAPVMPQYWGAAHGAANNTPTYTDTRFYEEYYGGEALDLYWKSIINVQKPNWVQICTWNDLDEASNVTSANLGPTGPWPYLRHSSVPGYYKSKLGLQAALSYYIRWYKTGQQPVLTNDTLVAYYRTQPAALVPGNDPLGPITQVDTASGQTTGPNATSAIPDNIFVDCYLAQPGEVTLSVGGTTQTQYAPAGVSHLRFPFVPGTPQITLSRLGLTKLTLNGEPIVSAADYVNANYFTSTAHN